MSEILPPSSEQPANDAESTKQILRCPVCGQVYRPGELTCSVCGTIFGNVGETQYFPSLGDKRPRPAARPAGNVFIEGQKPITLEIDQREVLLPLGQAVIIGRRADNPDDLHPDIDLSLFQAAEKGVSRQHIRISYKGEMSYVTDLGSRNGSWLNNTQLLPRQERVLRDGDELRLGQLRIKVRF
jgi:FHA domain